jgi:hypothetical protein
MALVTKPFLLAISFATGFAVVWATTETPREPAPSSNNFSTKQHSEPVRIVETYPI